MTRPSIIRLGFGALSKVNDLIVRMPESLPLRERVVYFGGDIQDVESVMRQHVSNYQFVNWSLEATAEILVKRFGPNALVVVVRPSDYYLATFSLFNNFLSSDAEGNPSFDASTDKAWRQIDLIMEEVNEKVDWKPSTTGNHAEKIADSPQSFHEIPLTLLGFSKGCAVLNQLVHEISFLLEVTDVNLKSVRVVRTMYWLDGGHNGKADTWVTDESVMEAFSKFYAEKKLDLHVHVTPYQMDDARRPHVRRHKLRFCELARKYDLTLHDETHFPRQNRAIELHFDILTSF